MPKKKLPQTIEECNAELERTQKQLQQYENRNKILNRKLSVEKRKERNHRIFLFGGFMESLVPELKAMTEDEEKGFLYHIAKSTEAQEYLKKRAEGWRLDNTLVYKGALIYPCGCRALISALRAAAYRLRSELRYDASPLPFSFCERQGLFSVQRQGIARTPQQGRTAINALRAPCVKAV